MREVYADGERSPETKYDGTDGAAAYVGLAYVPLLALVQLRAHSRPCAARTSS